MKRKKLLALFVAIVMTITLLPMSVAFAASDTRYYSVTADSVKLRESASFSADAVDTLTTGQIIYSSSDIKQVGGEEWIKATVDENNGKTGYIALRYLKKITAPGAATLRNIAIGTKAGKLSKTFKYSDSKLTAYLYSGVSSVNIYLSKRSGNTGIKIYVDDTEFVPQTEIDDVVAVPITDSTHTIKIVSYAGSDTKTYSISLLRDSEALANLSSLKLSSVKLSFKPDVSTYSATVASKVYETKLTVKTKYAGATVKFASSKGGISENTIPLYTGKNIVTVKVTSPLGTTTKTYKFTITRKKGAETGKMTLLEKKFVEAAFQLLPSRHPFKLAYEAAHGVKIKTYKKKIRGITVSGVPFQFGGTADIIGFSRNWWTRQSDPQYPVGGLDCAKYVSWIYRQIGYIVPNVSNQLFFSGKMGTTRTLPNGPTHKVITSLSKAKIGDVCYNSQSQLYRSGHGSHTTMFLGTARKLGIASTIRRYIRNFPVDKYLMIDVGWADGVYYYNMMRRLGISGRSSMCGVGIQFFPSVQAQNGKWIYNSPYRSSKKSYSWKDPQTHQTFTVGCVMEKYGRRMTYKAHTSVKYVLNISRPIIRTD